MNDAFQDFFVVDGFELFNVCCSIWWLRKVKSWLHLC